MEYSHQLLQSLEKEYGEAFYVLYPGRFAANFCALLSAFRLAYPNVAIAYSYKTNYIPQLCKAADDLGGYAEVVSDMEMALALRVGVRPEKIIFNGPYKKPGAVRELLLAGGTVHLDSPREVDLALAIAKEHPDRWMNVGIRVNFPIGDGVVSRFGFDAQGAECKAALRAICNSGNLHLRTLHCHFANRALETWKPRAERMRRLTAEYGIRPDCIDLGGGMFGRMDENLKRQFGGVIPTYGDYAQTIGDAFRAYPDGGYQPELIIEPGSALVGDCMDLVAKVQSVKTVRGQKIATVLASTHNIQMGSKTPTAEVVRTAMPRAQSGETIHIAGYTCIESDYLVKDFREPLSVGDYVVFRNVGSYSIVLKPPFILPCFPVLAPDAEGGFGVARRAETDRDVFQTYF